MTSRTGILLLVSGPSGSGKTTLCRRLSDEDEAHYSISCTTRPPREGEVDGRDYHFLDRDDFGEADGSAPPEVLNPEESLNPSVLT